MSIPALIASFFGLGYLPYMPGTWGTIGAFALSFIFLPSSFNILIGLTVLFTILGWYVSDLCLKATAHKNMDPSWIVIDEVAGYFCTIAIVAYFTPLKPLHLILAFICFRIFDITKPWPISWADTYLAKSNTTAAFGIMADDLIAGILAACFTLFACRIF